MTTSPTNHPTSINPSDAVPWHHCKRRIWLDKHAEFGAVETDDEFEQLIIDLGLEHEQQILAHLATTNEVQTAHSERHTRELMDQRADIIYQPQLSHAQLNIVGKPDFLIHTGNGVYQAADAKLSRNAANKPLQIQLGVYRRLLANDQPAIVFLGDGSKATIGDEADTLVDTFLTDMQDILSSQTAPSVHYSHSKCGVCPHNAHCKPQFEAAGALSLLYGIDGRCVPGLQNQGVKTISDLAASDPKRIADVPYLKGLGKKQRAVLQAKSYLGGAVHPFAEPHLPDGTWVHFDIEDDPLTESGEKHVYLWGFLVPGYQPDNFEYVWTDDESQDKAGWEAFLSQVQQYKKTYPNLKLIHYSAHERSTISAYARRYDMEDDDTVRYLLGDDSPLFDLQKPVLGSLVLPLQGYGLKDICKHPDLVNFQWQDDESGSQWSVVQFHRYLAATDGGVTDSGVTDSGERARLKGEILGYNRDDVRATRALEVWLRGGGWGVDK